MNLEQCKKAILDNRVCVIVPTYNNEGTVGKVIDGLLGYTDSVIAVNDGSTDRTADILASYGDRIAVVTHAPNAGKGKALRAGFAAARERGYRYAITIDSDGQHFVEDLPHFLEALEKEPAAIMVGARNMGQDSVPGKSKFGHAFSNFWFRVETGIDLPDTQSGYRLYPLELIEPLRFFTVKYEFEIEVIVRAAWRGVKVIPVPVRVVYMPKEERVSHFRPFRDFSRVSVLNTALVFATFLWVKPVSLLRKLHGGVMKVLRESLDSEPRIALAVAVGVLAGILPLWGLQMLLAVALATLLRVNRAIALVASNISVPPMIPIIVFASIKIGGYITGKPVPFTMESVSSISGIKACFLQYAVGGLALGLAAALAAWLITYSCLIMARKEREK